MGYMGNTVFFASFCCETKTSLKKMSIKKKRERRNKEAKSRVPAASPGPPPGVERRGRR